LAGAAPVSRNFVAWHHTVQCLLRALKKPAMPAHAVLRPPVARLPRLSRLLRPWLAAGLLTLGACGGGGGDAVSATTATAVATDSNTTGATVTATAAPAASQPTDGRGVAAVPASVTTASAPELPRAGLAAADLGVVIAEGDATSEAIALAYQRARGIPDANLVRVPVPAGSDVMGADDFARLKAAVDARLPASVQATLLTFTRPSRVLGSTCSMGITSAMALGYDAAYCGGCARTRASTYYDTDTTRPFSDLKIRPSMMLGASTLADAQVLIARGVAADGSLPRGTGWLVRTPDAMRSVRYTDWLDLPAAWAPAAGGLELRYVDASADPARQLVQQQAGVLFYFTGLARVDEIASNQWLPGAVADHLTSAAGVLPDGGGQMPATAWLAAGATASYGTVEEPCNHLSKFPKVSVLLDHYLRGATVLEAYWKSVNWPGQGLFVGEPLARPWPDMAISRLHDDTLELSSRAWRRGATYRVEGRSSATGAWQTLASRTAGQPRPTTWRVPVPPGTQALRLMGPCLSTPALTCVLGTDL
jgi:uncharacterized protein (TIGR03790 family)